MLKMLVGFVVLVFALSVIFFPVVTQLVLVVYFSIKYPNESGVELGEYWIPADASKRDLLLEKYIVDVDKDFLFALYYAFVLVIGLSWLIGNYIF